VPLLTRILFFRTRDPEEAVSPPTTPVADWRLPRVSLAFLIVLEPLRFRGVDLCPLLGGQAFEVFLTGSPSSQMAQWIPQENHV